MTASPVALALLGTAVLTLPPPPGSRLAPPRSRVRIPGGIAAVVISAVAITGVAWLSPAVAIAAVLLGLTGARRYRRRLCAIRRRRECQLIASALEVVVGELRAGAHPVDAFTAAASESDGPVARTLMTIASRARYGADVGAGLWEEIRMSAASDSWKRVAVCWTLAADHGLAMATLMAAAQQDIINRQRFSETIRAGLAGARTTATILAVLPIIGVLLGGLIGANPVSFLLGSSLGAVLMTIGTALTCAGVIWSDRIIERAAP